MNAQQFRLERFTRREFREARQAGHFKLAIVPVGSIEQHLEHLPFNTDIATSTYLAERIAQELYPDVLVVVPVAIGLSEHHMYFPGTLTAKPGSWIAVLYDAVEDLVRHGVKKVLILNGHGGNTIALENAIASSWRYQLLSTLGNPVSTEDAQSIMTHGEYVERLTSEGRQEIDIRSCNFWELMSEEFMMSVLDTDVGAGHAQEFETSFAMYAMPENVRVDAIEYSCDEGVSLATREKGRLLVEETVEGGIRLAKEMLSI